MEQSAIQETKTYFSSLLGNVLTNGQADAQTIEKLIRDYPYCQSLYMLRAAAAKENQPLAEKYIAQASVYMPDREVLYQVIHHPEAIAEKAAAVVETPVVYEEEPETPVVADTPISKVISEDSEEVPEESTPAIPDIPEKIAAIETVIPEQELPQMAEEPEQALPVEPTPLVEATAAPDDNLVFDNIASSDYFTFDQSAADPLTESEETVSPIAENNGEKANVLEKTSPGAVTMHHDAARYHDETLPYTFLWWLQKTRKEYAATYQPYVNFTLDTFGQIEKSKDAELNQQIIENIFHLQSPLKDSAAAKSFSSTVEFQLKKKEDTLIEKFIREEPHINPPRPEKIDTENKARKSAEDHYDLVSETLAAIYTEQMLYHKAIDTYKKLSLKFPEKSTYFAGQIKELQSKIN